MKVLGSDVNLHPYNKDKDLPEGVTVAQALARAGNLLLRRYTARAQADFLAAAAASREVLQEANYFNPAVHGDAKWAPTLAAFQKVFR